MATLNLPKPVHAYAGEDELRPRAGAGTGSANGHSATVNDASADDEDLGGEYRPPRASDKYKQGIIYPPGEIRKIIDKTAAAVSKTSKPLALEEKIKESQKTDPRFAFLNEDDPFHLYYRWKVATLQEEAEDLAKGITPLSSTPAPSAVAAQDATPAAPEPKSWEFKVDLPGVTAMDLDILRLTALFHARRGRSFLSSLSVREGRNYQFDFLRPTHSLYGYYNRMVESYQKVIQPPAGLVDSIVKADADPEAKWKTLAEARERAEWERGRRKREDEKAAERDLEAKAFATIDWQDFVTVETIEFTQADVDLDLPPPLSVEKLKVMSMAEKRMAAMIMEEPEAAAASMVPAPGSNDIVEEIDMEEDDDDEDARLQRIKADKEQARARDVQRAALESKGLKIKKDYVPKGIQRGGSVATAKCPYCGQSIPEAELSEHIRIELLDPRWKDQKRDLDARRAQAQQLQLGADISTSLKNLAAQRTDLFGDDSDEAERKRREEEALKKKRERETIIWDGHTASASKTETTFQTKFSAEDQIRRIHERMGVTDAPVNTVGPQAGPGIVAAPVPIPTPGAGGASVYSGATITAAPTGPSTREYYEAAPPVAAVSAAPPPSSGPSIHPARLAAMGVPATRPAPDDDEDEAPRPVFKRPRIEKLPYPQFYSEIDWMSLHPDPISLSVQLPIMPDKPEWKLDGSVIVVDNLPVKTLFSTLRERIKRIVDADLPISRVRIDYLGKAMSNAATLASVNLDEGDMVIMSVRKK